MLTCYLPLARVGYYFPCCNLQFDKTNLNVIVKYISFNKYTLFWSDSIKNNTWQTPLVMHTFIMGEFYKKPEHLLPQYDDVIKWKHFRVTGPLCREFTGDRWIPRTKASDAELWCFLWSAPWINVWVNNRDAGDLRRQCAHYDVIVMMFQLQRNERRWISGDVDSLINWYIKKSEVLFAGKWV